jgi:hypothetical protein
MKVYVDPACDIQHTGFFLLGFMGLSGRGSIVFSDRHGLGFSHNSDVLPLVVVSDGGRETRILLDYGDSPKYRDDLYEWADLYAKTNIREEDLPGYPKSMVLGRNMPIKAFTSVRTMQLGVSNYFKARHRIKDARRFFSLYRLMAFRCIPREEIETRLPSEDGYMHYVCTPWKNDTATNEVRANFMRAAKSIPGMDFEGGFTPRPDGYVPGYDDLKTNPFESYRVYMRKTQRSLAVFNNPSVKGCHSWKLAEYLCWGKAIVSTPLVRMLPAPLLDGIHVLYTDGTMEDMAGKLSLLRRDVKLRSTLERNARAYYDEHLAPDKMVAEVLSRAGIRLP